MRSSAVLHVTSLLGGGVDRHVRDIARTVGGEHLVWHVGDAAEVIEIPREKHYRVLDPARVEADGAAMADWLAAKRVGLVHAHTLHPKARERAAAASAALGVGTVATLHDVLFLRGDAFEPGVALAPDPSWLEANARFLARAKAVVAPSEFIASLARRHLPGVAIEVIPNGSQAPAGTQASPHPDFLRDRPRHVVAVLGAIGPHKGSDVIDALGDALAGSGIAIVVIGYLDRQLVPGWRKPGTLFIHGAYADAEVKSLVDGYGADIALFPNQVPESFSYALSDLWSCGLPVLAAPSGALAERIGRHGGGWLLPERFDAQAIAARLRELFSREGEVARVKSQLVQPDPARVPPLAAMARSLEALYDRFGVDPHAPTSDAAAIERLVATSLDGSLFRAELARLADEYAQLERAHAETLAQSRRFEAESREWIAKLERDVASLTAEIGKEVEQRRALGEENAQLAIHKAAFDKLPEMVRRWLLKKVLDARS